MALTTLLQKNKHIIEDDWLPKRTYSKPPSQKPALQERNQISFCQASKFGSGFFCRHLKALKRKPESKSCMRWQNCNPNVHAFRCKLLQATMPRCTDFIDVRSAGYEIHTVKFDALFQDWKQLDRTAIDMVIKTCKPWSSVIYIL